MQQVWDNIVSILVFLSMLVVMVVVLYILDAHWIWSIVAVGVFGVLCVGRIIYESTGHGSSDSPPTDKSSTDT